MNNNSAKTSEIYALSAMQAGMLYHSLKEPEQGYYTEQILITFSSKVSLEHINKAWEKIFEKHEVLRTVVNVQNQTQKIEENPGVQIDVQDISQQSTPGNIVDQYLINDRQKQFDFSNNMNRLKMFILDHSSSVLVWSFHHLLLDGRSITIVLQDFFRFYERLLTDNIIDEINPVKYMDYIDFISSEKSVFEKSGSVKKYWQQMFCDYEPMHSLHQINFQNKKIELSEYIIRSKLSDNLSQNIRKLAASFDITINTIMQSAWAILLSNYTGSDDVVFGNLRACRKSHIEDAENMAGLFMNNLPLRIKINDDTRINDLFLAVRKSWLSMRPYENTALPDIQDWVGQTNLFETEMNYEKNDFESISNKNKTATVQIYEKSTALLSLSIQEAEELNFKIQYNAEKFDAESIKKLSAHYQIILEQICEKPTGLISNVTLLTEEEKHLLLVQWNNTQADYNQHSCLHQLIENQVAITPDNIALVYAEEKLTYRELNEKANKLARYLGKHHVNQGDYVGLCVNRSAEMVIALLAIIKAGAAYIPIDPHYPKSRIDMVLEDTQLTVVISETNFADKLTNADDVVFIDQISAELDLFEVDNLSLNINSESLAYTIFTSGSTGRPKGVQISHKAIVNFVTTIAIKPGLTAVNTLLSVTTISFDIFGLELYVPLTVGAKVVIASSSDVIDGKRLIKLIEENEVDTLHATPTTYKLLLTSGWEGAKDTKVMVGGEPLPKLLAKRLLANCKEVWNMYGPTETTIWSTIQKIESVDQIYIGKPIGNTDCYILNKNKHPVPIGVIGELFIGGDSVSTGYLRNIDLTTEKFIASPFKDNKVIYDTGDLARFVNDGTIEIFGRSDNQVKVNGFRIELGEIESRMSKHPHIKEAVALVRDDINDYKIIVGYYISNIDVDVDVEQLSNILAQTLTDYMMPSIYMRLDKFPLTPNGKIDRKSFPKPLRSVDEKLYTEATTDMERQLVQLFSDILCLDRVGTTDDFFKLGGNSLSAMTLVARIDSELGKEVSIINVFRHSTIDTLAKLITHTEELEQDHALHILKDTGSLQPLFFIGSTSYGKALAEQMSADHPVFGLNIFGLEKLYSNKLHSFTIHDIAFYFYQQIISLQAEGPYHIAGYCADTSITVEIARLLKDNDKEVALCGFFDVPDNFGSEQEVVQLSTFEKLKEKISIFGPRYLWVYTRRKFGVLKTKFLIQYGKFFYERQQKSEKDVDPLFRDNAVLRRYLAANLEYKPQKLNISVVVFRSSEWFNKPTDILQSTVNNIKFYEIPGSHSDLFMNKKSVKILADKVSLSLL